MPELLRVVHLIDNAARSPYLCTFADHGDRRRFDTTIGTLTPPGQLQEDLDRRGVKTFSLRCEDRLSYVRATLQFATWLRSWKIRVVQVHLFDSSVVGLLAARLARIPLCIFTGHHSLEVVESRRKVPLMIDRFCAGLLAHKIIAPSEQMRRVLIDDVRVSAKKIAVIPYGFETSRLALSETARRKVRCELGLGDAPVFGAVGRLSWVKNYPVLLRAFARFNQEVPQARLLVVGGGPDEEPLRRLAGELRLLERVVFTGFRSDIVEVMGAIDVLVHSSLAESFGQVIVEALALGRPVVSTPVGISREVVVEGETGVLAGGYDEEALVRALHTIFSARARWPAWGANAMRVAGRFAADRVVGEQEAQVIRWLEE